MGSGPSHPVALSNNQSHLSAQLQAKERRWGNACKVHWGDACSQVQWRDAFPPLPPSHQGDWVHRGDACTWVNWADAAGYTGGNAYLVGCTICLRRIHTAWLQKSDTQSRFSPKKGHGSGKAVEPTHCDTCSRQDAMCNKVATALR